MSVEQRFLNYIKKIDNYEEALSVIYWDMRTGAPKKGLEQRAEVVGTISSELFRLQTSDELAEILQELSTKKEELSEIVRRSYEETQKAFDLNKKIPADEYKAYVVLQSKAEAVWEQAKEKSDFSLFLPYLKGIIEAQQKFVTYWGIKDNNPYNTLLTNMNLI